MSAPEDALTEALTADGGASQRLAAAMAATAEVLSLQRCHLYVRSEPSEPYRLVTGWTGQDSGGAADRLSVRELPSAGTDTDDQAAEATPGLELRAPVPADLVPVPTPVGPLLPVSLEVPEQLDAVLLLGPPGRGLSLLDRRRLERLRSPLRAVLAALHREMVLERELDAVASRAETGKRLRDSALAPDRFLRLLLDLAVRSTTSEGGFVAVSDPAGTLSMRVAAGLPARLGELDVTPGTGVFDWSLADTGALLLRDPEQAARLDIRSALAVPLLGPRGPLGVVGLTTSTRRAAFTEHSLQLLGSLAEQVGLMLENERAFADFSQRYLRVLQGIAETLDARRPETVGYHRQVGRLAAVLAQSVGLDGDEVSAAREAGLIHDVGLAAVPAATRAFLSDVEHPSVGADLVEGMPVHPGIASAIATHHEWYDGWGFPSGLRGNDIPVLGRVLALAAFSAEMSTGDLSRPAWTADRVLHEVQQRSGSQFDPELVDSGAVALGEALSSTRTAERGTA